MELLLVPQAGTTQHTPYLPGRMTKMTHVRILVGPQSELSLGRSYPAGGEIVTTCIIVVEVTGGYIFLVVKVSAYTE